MTYGAKIGCGYNGKVCGMYIQVSLKSEGVLIFCVELTWNVPKLM